MVHKVFTIYDSKAEAYMNPFVSQSTGAAIRAFSDEVNSTSTDSQLAKHPEDFTLFEIASWNPVTGQFEIYEAKKSCGMGLDHQRVVDQKSLKAVN